VVPTAYPVGMAYTTKRTYEQHGKYSDKWKSFLGACPQVTMWFRDSIANRHDYLQYLDKIVEPLAQVSYGPLRRPPILAQKPSFAYYE
jgi:hypothetical protein